MNTKNKLIICVGISGSSKTTWSSQYIKDNPNTLRINRDDIRKTLVGDLNGYYQRKDLNFIEDRVTETEDDLFHRFMVNSKNMIIDNTNLKQSYINKWIKLAKAYEQLCEDWEEDDIIDIQFKLFDISLEKAKERVIERELNSTNDEGFKWWKYEKEVEYINKQFMDYYNIKQYLLTNYSDQII